MITDYDRAKIKNKRVNYSKVIKQTGIDEYKFKTLVSGESMDTLLRCD